MFNLYYWAHQPKLMCTFHSFSDCNTAVDLLREKYPTAKIWMEKVTTIGSVEEWEHIYNRTIIEYETLK